jgi:NhaA family Na+:H+ antiporter
MVRIEHTLSGWVNFLIMPVFAFANAGVTFIGGNITAALFSRVTLGIFLGLFVGKQVGVLLFSWASVRLDLAEMPTGTTWKQFYGVSLLAGIGFTMSLFIATLAFGSGEALANAKIGILAASVIAGLAGWFVLSRAAAGVADTVVAGTPVSAGPSLTAVHGNVRETSLTDGEALPVEVGEEASPAEIGEEADSVLIQEV